jgi:hypothetical protein
LQQNRGERCQPDGGRQQDNAGTCDDEEDAVHTEPMTLSKIRSRVANYASSDQVCSPHLHLVIFMDLPVRESSSVRTSVGTAPHRLHVRSGTEAAPTSTTASGSTRSLTPPSSKRSDVS